MKMKISRLNNPILVADPESEWLSRTVMNPGVAFFNGKYRMVFTAGAPGGVYHLGYAESSDGEHFTVGDKPFFSPDPNPDAFDHGTAEDPRVTELDGKFYICYAARYMPTSAWARGERRFGPGGDNAPSWEQNSRRVGIAVTEDWKTMKRLGPLSSPFLNDANVALFPERINGKYAFLHRPSSSPAWALPMFYEPGRAWLLYTDTVNKWCSDRIEMPWNMKFGTDIPDDSMLLEPERDWEMMKVGPSGVPIPTDDGWLMFYHGVDRVGVYRVGLALLDRENPRKVLCRTPEPVMEPTGELESTGPYPKCIFPCANVVAGDEIRLFYGICDKCIGAAVASLAEALAHVKQFKVNN